MAAKLERPVGKLEVLDRPAEIRSGRCPNSAARGVVRHHQRAVVVEHELGAARRCRTRLRGGCRTRPARARGPVSAAITRTRSRSVGLITLRNTRRLSSTGVNRSACVISISDLPSNRNPRRRGEVESAQDLRLRLGGEVHERVAADEQVDPRDRCVLDEVVAAEDHAAAQVLAEHVALVGPLEEALERVVAARPRSAAAGTRHAARWSSASSSTSVA